MQTLYTFGQALVRSLTQPHYYADILKARFWFSFKYLMGLQFLVALLVTTRLFTLVLNFNLANVIMDIGQMYPAKLVIRGDEDGIDINQERPYRVEFPQGFAADIEGNNLALVTFDTDENIKTPKDFAHSKSMFLLTESTVYTFRDYQSGEIAVYEMPSFTESFVISADDVKVVQDKLVSHPFVARRLYLPLIAMVLFVCIFPMAFLFRLISLLLLSVIVWLITSLLMSTKKLTFGQIYQLGMHSLTLPTAIAQFFFVLPEPRWHLGGWWFTVIFVIWTLFIISKLPLSAPAAVSRGITSASASRSKRLQAKTVKKSVKKSGK